MDQSPRPVYNNAFRGHVFRMLRLGFEEARGDLKRDLEEEEVTQFLVEGIERVRARLDLPEELIHYTTKEDKPHRSEGRTGKRRRRVDIVVTRTMRGPQPTFSFEAKRMIGSGSVAAYIGPKGIERFVSEAYAADEAEAGMLGYVQEGAGPTWMSQITEAVNERGLELRLWESMVTDDSVELRPCSRSQHDRPTRGRLTLFHFMLDCA